jgi:serine/threonine-protein kinase
MGARVPDDDQEQPGEQTAVEPEEKRSQASPLWYALALALLALVVLWILMQGMGRASRFGDADSTTLRKPVVPLVLGKTIEDASRAITNVGFRVEARDSIDDDAQPGVVIAQTPKAGVELLRGSTVVVDVATRVSNDEKVEPPPSSPVTVPDLVGKSRASATRAVETAGYVASVGEAYSSTATRGKVMSQYPSAGTYAETGSTVSFKVCVGPAPNGSTGVPDVSGLSRTDAESKISAAGFAYYEVQRPDEKHVNGVIDQWPKPGTKLVDGGEVMVLYGISP